MAPHGGTLLLAGQQVLLYRYPGAGGAALGRRLRGHGLQIVGGLRQWGYRVLQAMQRALQETGRTAWVSGQVVNDENNDCPSDDLLQHVITSQERSQQAVTVREHSVVLACAISIAQCILPTNDH